MKSRLILASALAATFAVPATATAAGSISGGPVEVAGGYAVTLHAVDAKEDSLTITVDRGTVARGQTDHLMVTRGVRVTVRGASASIKGSLGRRGAVDLRLRNARVLPGEKPPKGCTGSTGKMHGGVLQGKLRLRLPNGKSVTIRSLRATTYVDGKLDCKEGASRGPKGDGSGGGDGGGEPRLMLNTKADGATVSFVATKSALNLTRIVEPKKDRGATVSALAIVRASGANLLTVSGGGAQAGVKSAGAFTGAGGFTATLNTGSFASGPLTGSLKVQVQGAPVISIVGEDAMLLDGDKAAAAAR